jgi:hypothetical protein
LLGRLPPGPALQVAQDDQDSVLVRQGPEFPVEDRAEVGPEAGVGCNGLGGFDGFDELPLTGNPPGPHLPRLPGRLAGRPVEPVGDRLARGDGRRPAHEDDERGLEGVFGVVLVAEDAAADAPHHRGVAAHERLDRLPVAVADESLQ